MHVPASALPGELGR